ncbi:MAG TPA: MFS transporter [Firmicutes bacterium]|nr:MFS transporter [Bacillota bacterium]
MPNKLSDVPILLASVAEGVVLSLLYSYGPLYMWQALAAPSLTQAALSVGLASFAAFVTAGIWGRWGDRFGRKEALIGVGMLLSSGGLAALSLVRNVHLFLALAVLTVTGIAAGAPLGVAWLTLRAPDRPGAAAARYYRARTLGWTLGSYAAGYIVQQLNMQGLIHIFRAGAGLCLLAAMLLFVMALGQHNRQPSYRKVGNPAAADDNTAKPSLPQVTGTAVWRQPLVPAVLVAVLLSFGGNEAFMALMGPYLTDYLHGSAAWVGYAVGTASFLGIFVIGRIGKLADRRGPGTVFTLGTYGYALMFLLMTLLRYPSITLMLFTIPLYPFISTGVTGLMVRYVPAAQRGEAIGVYEGTASLATSLGSMAGGVAADVCGLWVTPVFSLLLSGVGALTAWLGVLRIIRKTAVASTTT